MLSCYNRGCGKDFDPNNNPDDACRYHPGLPFFHDAFKGWSCCNKRSVDFTEFLNIKGCEMGQHSNVKPLEPVKPEAAEEIEVSEPSPPIVELKKPAALERPDFNELLVPIEATVAPTLKQSIDNLVATTTIKANQEDGEIPLGTACKNSGCNCSYDPSIAGGVCVYHSGVPIFHEGLKYWSCCTKRTSDFTAFLNQKGCTEGKHKWIKDQNDMETVKCRYDWHQSGSQVVIAIYAKMYHYAKSFVKLNPIRLVVSLVFPQQNDAVFNLDLELRGIVDVAKTKVQMLGTKIEITLKKAEPGNWVKLDFPRAPIDNTSNNVKPSINALASNYVKKDEESDDSDVDLNSIQPVSGITITEA